MLRRPEAIIFDAYDTLFANSRDAWKETFQTVAEQQKLPITGSELWELWKRYEIAFRTSRVALENHSKSPPFKSYEAAWRDCFQRVFDDRGIEGDAAGAARMAVENMGRREPFPETVRALQELEGRVRLGMFSNADDDFLLPMLEPWSLPLEAVASSESARVYKPATEAFDHILRLMGLPPDRAWYVGDNPFDDILGARRAGMHPVWIDRSEGGVAPDPLPDATITDLRDLLRLLDATG